MLARQNPVMAFTSLNHYLDYEWLYYAYELTRKDGVVGVDGQTAAEYAERLEESLHRLLHQLKSALEREALLFGEAIANHPAQPRDVEPRIETRLLLRHAVGLVVDFRLGLEVRGHQLDDASDEIFFGDLGFDRTACDESLDQMSGESVDLGVGDRHG